MGRIESLFHEALAKSASQRSALASIARRRSFPRLSDAVESGLNFGSRLKIPILMIKGHNGFANPVAMQKPMFRWFGTPEKDKRHVLWRRLITR